jgi:hypothetical protein
MDEAEPMTGVLCVLYPAGPGQADRTASSSHSSGVSGSGCSHPPSQTPPCQRRFRFRYFLFPISGSLSAVLLG